MEIWKEIIITQLALLICMAVAIFVPMPKWWERLGEKGILFNLFRVLFLLTFLSLGWFIYIAEKS